MNADCFALTLELAFRMILAPGDKTSPAPPQFHGGSALTRTGSGERPSTPLPARGPD